MSHHAALAALLADRPMCPDCLAAESGLGTADLDAALAAIQTALQLHGATGRCRACGIVATVLSIGPPGRLLPLRDQALWEFLEQHRGEMFCTQCLAKGLGVTARIDRSVMVAEGRGARRRHDECAMCGKPRLVCGLPA